MRPNGRAATALREAGTAWVRAAPLTEGVEIDRRVRRRE